MAGRPPRNNGMFPVSIHIIRGYRYACSCPGKIDAHTGKTVFSRIHWGTVDENLKFFPNSRFIYADPDETAALVFPKDWDLSEIDTLAAHRQPGRPPYSGEDSNRLYGDVWLLEQIASKSGLRKDLESVFEGNKDMVDAILTLAMFPLITQHTYNRIGRWQRTHKTPSARELNPSDVTRLLQSITESHRMDLVKLRAKRLSKDELCAVDSTTVSSYGTSLAEVRWSKSNKEHLPLPQTVEVVVYALTSHMPVYYRTFQGNIPDSRSLQTILTDLSHAGFPDVILVTDRGYETIRYLETYILKGQAMIMCAKVRQELVADTIMAFNGIVDPPQGMAFDAEKGIYYAQYDIDYSVMSKGTAVKESQQLRINLYFDIERRGSEMKNLEIVKMNQKMALDALLAAKAIVDDDTSLERLYKYYTITYDPETRVIQSYSLNPKKVEEARRYAGFFSIITHKVDMTAMEVLHAYGLRDEQEKCFQLAKTFIGADRNRSWTQSSKDGRTFVLFVSLILGSQLRYVWKSTKLKEMFSSSMEILDEMASIRCIEHTGKNKHITPFVGSQVDICKAFGFDIPEGCAPKYPSRKKHPKRRGRPPKAKVYPD